MLFPCISQMQVLAMITWKERKARATYSSFSFWSCFLNSKPMVESVDVVGMYQEAKQKYLP